MSDQPNGAVATDVLAMFATAAKHQLKARVAIDGPTGSGKTYTALQWARILAGLDGKVGFIDTEEESALFYAPTLGAKIERVNFWDPPYEFQHMPWRPPYDPRKLAQVLKAAAPHFDVLVVDSGTHFWTGEGGTLDIVDGAFTGWKEGSPAQRYLLDTFLRLPCHFIMCMRSKMEYVVEEKELPGKDGKLRKKMVPRKIGLQPEQRAGIEYEFTVVADMDLDHRLVVSKTRCDVVADVVALKGRSAEVAQKFAEWLDSGIAMPTTVQLEEMKERLNNITPPVGGTVRQAFRERFGTKLDRLTLEEFNAAAEWVTATIIEATAALAQAGGSAAPVEAQEPSGGDFAPETAAPVSEGSSRLSGPPIPTAEGQPPLPEQDPDYADRIVAYVDLLPKPLLAEMCAKRGFPLGDKVDVMRARISVALVSEAHPAPTEETLEKLRKGAAPAKAGAAAK